MSFHVLQKRWSLPFSSREGHQLHSGEKNPSLQVEISPTSGSLTQNLLPPESLLVEGKALAQGVLTTATPQREARHDIGTEQFEAQMLYIDPQTISRTVAPP